MNMRVRSITRHRLDLGLEQMLVDGSGGAWDGFSDFLGIGRHRLGIAAACARSGAAGKEDQQQGWYQA
jgi:hypothetical protein